MRRGIANVTVEDRDGKLVRDFMATGQFFLGGKFKENANSRSASWGAWAVSLRTKSTRRATNATLKFCVTSVSWRGYVYNFSAKKAKCAIVVAK